MQSHSAHNARQNYYVQISPATVCQCIVIVTFSYKLLGRVKGAKLYKTETELHSVLKHLHALPICPGLSFLTGLSFDMYYLFLSN